MAEWRDSGHNQVAANLPVRTEINPSSVTRFTILVVEDFPGYRQFVCRELKQNPAFDIFAVEDGLEAVDAAQELQPDLVLLDIGLPRLNGIAAGERIRARCPASKIMFLTQESSTDFVHSALAMGSHGYIHKLRAHGCLLAAVEAILERHPDVQPPHRHMAQFYSDDEILMENAERFIASALNAHDAAVVIATTAHLDALTARLKCCRINIDRAVQEGTLRQFDVREVLSQIMATGLLDADLFRTMLSEVLESAAGATRKADARVAVYGECAALLCAADNVDAAIRLEQVGNELLARSGSPAIDIMCSYPLPHAAFRRICSEHSVVAVC
jgi:DNA-binding NarL/FixJ family response regulator